MTETKRSGNVFGIRNYRLVFFGSLVSDVGSVLSNFALSFYILEITDNNAFLQGLFLALGSAVLLLVTPFGGVFGDRYNKARIMYLCDYIKGGIMIFATVFMMLFKEKSAHIVILFALTILFNFIGGFFSPASSALLPEIVEPELFQQANSYFTVKSSFNSIFGVVLAGILYAAIPVQVLFIAVGVCYILSGVSEMFVRYEYVPNTEPMSVKLVFSDMKDGLVYLKGQKAIMAFMGAILFINFFFNPIFSNFVPYFIATDVAAAESYVFDKVITPELWMSIFNVLLAACSLIGAVIMSTKQDEGKVGHKIAFRILLMSFAMIAMSIGYQVFVRGGKGLSPFLILICLCSAAIGLDLPAINIPVSTVIMKLVDSKMLSKVMGLINVLSQGLIPVSSVLAGAILQKLGTITLLVSCSAGFTLTAVYMLLNKEVKEI